MKAREVISGSSRDPAVVTLLCRAYEIAWMKITDNFGDDEAAAERARQKLAEILLALPSGDERDPEKLADLALETMALEPRTGR
jgi:hypothetical protein